MTEEYADRICFWRGVISVIGNDKKQFFQMAFKNENVNEAWHIAMMIFMEKMASELKEPSVFLEALNLIQQEETLQSQGFDLATVQRTFSDFDGGEYDQD